VQVAASRDMFATDVLHVKQPVGARKRKFYEVSELAKVPSSSIVTTGRVWQLFRYYQHPEPSLVQSQEMELPLSTDVQTDVLKSGLKKILLKVMGMLELQVEKIDTGIEWKKVKQ
jgi:hypothetical protein